MKTEEEPRLIAKAVRRSPAESRIIMHVAAELPQTEPSKLSWKDYGGGGSHAKSMVLSCRDDGGGRVIWVRC